MVIAVMEVVPKGLIVMMAVLLMTAASFDERSANSVDEVVNEHISIEDLFAGHDEDVQQRQRSKRFYIQELDDDEDPGDVMADRMDEKIAEPPSVREVNLPWYIYDVLNRREVRAGPRNSNEKYHDY